MYNQITSNKQKTILLIGIYLILITGIGWMLSVYFGNPAILYIAVGISVVQALVGYYSSDKIALAVSGAKPITGKEGRWATQLINMVKNLSITAGLPEPKLFFIDDTAINAFATGRDPKHASIAVTRGAIERLEDEELQGVLAHELSHVKNYDIRVMSIVVVLAGIIAVVSDLAIRSMWYSNRDSENRSSGVTMLIALAFSLLAPIAATLIQLAVSRKREYLADASGALLTRYPEGLARALEKIAADHEPLEVANKGTAHLYIANPLKSHGSDSIGLFSKLFSTHPPVKERIKILRSM